MVDPEWWDDEGPPAFEKLGALVLLCLVMWLILVALVVGLFYVVDWLARVGVEHAQLAPM